MTGRLYPISDRGKAIDDRIWGRATAGMTQFHQILPPAGEKSPHERMKISAPVNCITFTAIILR
ncbi:hypothetical protein [Bradyrhizobium sp. BWA-3-5]|uniref:hypothetical protein n=1 Tax=Bradyrhizobium sp. BWA-3-5 TaxID=3080013 RepID=UPI00293E62D4|nr:hypothetical protein [Bradyrhizobium sp. BWA-3-5]WOH65007.1 hypothetical protein RX331_31345 [Bradyrhizobium sp. BWA-3-5]